MSLTPKLDLRGGQPCWRDVDESKFASDPAPDRTDILIVGAGIVGAILALRLSKGGRRVAVLDRRIPATGSISASTALVMWAADTPLTSLAELRGWEKARLAWRRVHRAVQDLDEMIGANGIPCSWRPRSELYLAGTLLDPDNLRREGAARQDAGLSSTFLPAPEVGECFGIRARDGLLSADSFSVDPVALTLGLLRSARDQGALVTFPTEVEDVEHRSSSIFARMSGGHGIEAKHVILATGYETPGLFLPDSFSLGSSFAVATPPGIADANGDLPLIWEASDPYLYQRTTADGRIIIGGEDIDACDPDTRDGLLAAKRGRLAVAGAALLGREGLPIECAWSATFGRSPDGLPAIGKARNSERIWLAAGFGGNGISFASLAAGLIADGLAGDDDPAASLFDPYRPMPGTR